MRKVSLFAVFVIISLLMLGLFEFGFVRVEKAVSIVQPLSSTPSVFSDEFTGVTLDSRWNIIDPYGDSTFSLTADPGWLRIAAPSGRDLLPSKFDAPRLAQSVSGDFSIETKVSAIENQNDEGAGITIWRDSSNYVRLERMSRTIGGPVQQQILFGGSVNGVWPCPGDTSLVLSSAINPTYLKLIKQNNVLTGWYGSDGTNWSQIGTIPFSVSDPVNLGLAVVNVYHSGSFYADFDYYRLSSNSAGLVGYWNFEEGNGIIVSDLSGHNNNGLVYGAQWVQGNYGKALRFDGINDYVTIPNSASLNFQGAQPFTLMAWIKLDATQQGQGECVIDKFSNYGLLTDHPETRFRSVVFRSGSVFYSAGGVGIAPNLWHQYVGVYDPPYLIAYLDGAEAARSNVGSLLLDTNNGNVTIGASQLMESWFTGIVDEVRIYNRALAGSEISSLYVNSANTYSGSDNWSMFHNDLLHTGYSASIGPTSNAVLWSQVVGTTNGRADYSPVVADGKVYTGSTSGALYCFDATTGLILWASQIGDTASSPAVLNGKIYVGSNNGNIYCLDASSGTKIWNYLTSSPVGSSPAVSNGLVYVGSQDGNLYCLNADTGAKIWSFYTGPMYLSSPAIFNGKVYAIGSFAYCLDAQTGSLTWQGNVGTDGNGSPMISNGLVYLGYNRTGSGRLDCVDAQSGSVIWSDPFGAAICSTPAIANDKIYVGSSEDKIYCLDAHNGLRIWSYEAGSYDIRSSPAVSAGLVYFTDVNLDKTNGKIYCLNATTGGTVWTYVTRSIGGFSSPAVLKGILYVGAGDKFYAIGQPAPKTWIVDSQMTGDFTIIQAAIDAANSGDTIYVKRGTYTAPTQFSKTVTLLGENRQTTSISGEIHVNANNVTISNFGISFLWVENSDNCTVNNIISEIRLLNSSGNMIENSLLKGIGFDWSHRNIVYNNTISGNSLRGIGASYDTSDNVIANNTIFGNPNGILAAISASKFYHNVIVNNNVQVYIYYNLANTWDDGYPSGGNYWSDYSGHDSNGDGIGDTPYIIDGYNRDNYPFMSPSLIPPTPQPIQPTANFTFSPATGSVGVPVTFNASLSTPGIYVGQNSRIVQYQWSFGDGSSSSTDQYLILHTYTIAKSYNVSLTVFDAFGANASTSQVFQVKMLTSISISTFPSSLIGSAVTVTGNLTDIYGNKLSNQTVVISYTFAGLNSWIPISSSVTDSSGGYGIQWVNTATGTFILKAEWAGNATFNGANNTITLSSVPYQNQYVFLIESNSTISSMIFNATSSQLAFTVSGDSGTHGYSKLTIAKSLFSNIANVTVLVDGSQVLCSITSTPDSWLLSFSYTHSSHSVTVNLAAAITPQPSPSPSPTPTLTATPTTSPIATLTPTPTPTPAPTLTPVPTNTPTSAPTAAPTPTLTPTQTTAPPTPTQTASQASTSWPSPSIPEIPSVVVLAVLAVAIFVLVVFAKKRMFS